MAQVEVQYPNQPRFALHSRSFRIFMAGSLLSRVGDWMDLVALNWAVLQFTNSPLHLGLINACRLVPTFLLSVPAGVMADRYDRRKLLIWLQVGIMLLTFCIAYLMAIGSPFWLFAAVVTLRSILTAMDPPIRNALIPNLVPETSMASAIAINTTVINLSRIVGPAIAGALLAVMKIETVFWISAWSVAAVLLSLMVIRPESDRDVAAKSKGKANIYEAIAYVKQNPSVQSLLILAIVPMVFGFPYTSMMPVFARDLMQLGPEGFGALLSISSIGAIAGSAWLSIGREMKGAGKWLVCSVIGFGLSLLLFVVTSNFLLAAIAMFLVGLTSQTYRTMSRITLQMQVPDPLRGRILSIALMDRGFIPLGAIMIGAIAGWAGTLWAGLVMGAGCVAVTLAVIFARRQIWYL
ncbi:MFS transporter [Effusibacillus lacus]|uniref:MFS transporter n=1 Tax=Effusibacillus lacus TaxID=1348429 RepID=A0A292YJ86_9BACL|nr:MFS transporter [Effusibacillus lacus]TCS70958.1 putative MFS family arabinose efflux permease [Effusibacillus lacus]GAX90008.1 MFS transporter [Effusibacillus lacus]